MTAGRDRPTPTPVRSWIWRGWRRLGLAKEEETSRLAAEAAALAARQATEAYEAVRASARARTTGSPSPVQGRGPSTQGTGQDAGAPPFGGAGGGPPFASALQSLFINGSEGAGLLLRCLRAPNREHLWLGSQRRTSQWSRGQRGLYRPLQDGPGCLQWCHLSVLSRIFNPVVAKVVPAPQFEGTSYMAYKVWAEGFEFFLQHISAPALVGYGEEEIRQHVLNVQQHAALANMAFGEPLNCLKLLEHGQIVLKYKEEGWSFPAQIWPGQSSGHCFCREVPTAQIMLTGEMGSLQYKSGEPIVDFWNKATDLKERNYGVYGRMDNQEWLRRIISAFKHQASWAAMHSRARTAAAHPYGGECLRAVFLEEEARREALKGGRNEEIPEAHLGKGVGPKGKGGKQGVQDPCEEELEPSTSKKTP